MNTTLLVITDGRGECLSQTLNSFAQKVKGHITHSLMIDDSANGNYAMWLDETFGGWFDHIEHHAVRKGFAGALQSGWLRMPETDFIFHLEDDFIFNKTIDLDKIADVLIEFPYLAQIVLKRQPVNSAEIAAGGIVELHPDDYTERYAHGLTWTEHQRNFSTNPCMYSDFIAQLGFPQETGNNERLFSDRLNQMGFRYAFWGKKFDAPIVEHIGKVRVGIGY